MNAVLFPAPGARLLGEAFNMCYPLPRTCCSSHPDPKTGVIPLRQVPCCSATRLTCGTRSQAAA